MVNWIIVQEETINDWYKKVNEMFAQGYILHPESFSVGTNKIAYRKNHELYYIVLMSKQ